MYICYHTDSSVIHNGKVSPVMYKATLKSTKGLCHGSHAMVDSQHYLVDWVADDNTFSAYFVNKASEVDWREDILLNPSADVIYCSAHASDDVADYAIAVEKAREELEMKSKWESSDHFVTAMKCGREHSVGKEYIVDRMVKIVGCTRITPKVTIGEGDHLIFNDFKNSSHSVLVTKCLDCTQVTVIPSVHQVDVLDLTMYPEVFRVEYSDSLPAERAISRANSRCGLQLLQKCSQADHSMFVSWSKTGKELSLPPAIFEPKVSYESLQATDAVQVGDHIVELIESNHRHFIVTQKSEMSMFSIVFCQTGGLVCEETVNLKYKELYRVLYVQECLPNNEAVDRVRSQVGQSKHSCWDQVLFITQAKLDENGHDVVVTNCSQITGKEQISKGDHLILKTSQKSVHSVLVVEFLDNTKVVVKPSVDGCNEINLNLYPWAYRIEYSDSISPNVGKETLVCLSLPEFIKENLSVEAVSAINQIKIGDHLIEYTKSSCRHFIVTANEKKSIFAVAFRQASGIICEEKVDMSGRKLHRLVCSQTHLSAHEAVEQARLQIGQHNHIIPWDELLFTLQDMSCKRPVSKTQITSFSQLQFGDYLIKQPRMGSSHHYIVAFIGEICTVIECRQGKVLRDNIMANPEPNKYPKYYRVNYKPGACIAPKESVDMALSLENQNFSRRNLVPILKTKKEIEIRESTIDPSTQNQGTSENNMSMVSKYEITDFSQLQLGDHLIKEPRIGASHHYIIVAVASSGMYTAVESYQGKLSKVNLTLTQCQEKFTKYYHVSYSPSDCVPVQESVKKALLLVDKSFVHLLKTNEEDAEIDESSVELATTGQHSYASPQYIKSIASVDDIREGDHIVYSITKPPFQPVYCSSLVVKLHSDVSDDMEIITLAKEGLVEKKLFFSLATNLGKVVYQGCPFSVRDVVIRGKKALQFKDKEHYHEECNNSHHFVTRIKAGRESSLLELLKIFVKSTSKGK